MKTLTPYPFTYGDATVNVVLDKQGVPHVNPIQMSEILGYETVADRALVLWDQVGGSFVSCKWLVLRDAPYIPADYARRLVTHAPVGKEAASRFADWLYGEILPQVNAAATTEETAA